MRSLLRLASFYAWIVLIGLVPQFALAAVVPVNILDNSFSPQTVNIEPGDVVSWTNYGAVTHTVTADNDSFSSTSLTPGANFSYTFNTPGTYAYHDQSFGGAGGAGMSGVVNVAGSAPASGSGTVSSLQAQAQALIAEINQLEKQIAAGGSAASSNTAATTENSSACPNIGRSLKLGSSGDDVSRLQAFLAQDPSIYPAGLVTGYFGALTQAAVEAWQTKYNIVSSGTPATTGFGVVGPRTAAAIALLCSTGSTTGTTTSSSAAAPTNTVPTVGGLVQVTPISGNAPLTVNIQTTVNTFSSCVGAQYFLNYGDGSSQVSIPTASGNCIPVIQQYTHTYANPGTYQITLSAGTHATTASVTVTPPPQTSTTTPAPATSTAPSLPADSMQASILSGLAPLTVVFTGTASSLSTYGCSGSCSDTINFGDGAVGIVQLPTTQGTWQSYIISHTYTSAGTYVAQLESPTGAQDGSPVTITASNPPASQTSTSTGSSSAASTTSNTSSNNSQPTGGSYGIINLSTNGSSIPVTVTAQISLPACGGYEISWGDSSALSTGTGACTQGGSSVLVTHQYSNTGTYTVALKDGNGTTQSSSSIDIQ